MVTKKETSGGSLLKKASTFGCKHHTLRSQSNQIYLFKTTISVEAPDQETVYSSALQTEQISSAVR